MGSQPLVVVMGISGVGKSAVGHELAERLSVEYADGDDFHTKANIQKMATGHPLTDGDRWPWLHAIGGWLAEHEEAGGVISCSALRRVYRDKLVDAAPRAAFLHLYGDHDLIRSRIESRKDHFMPASLLASQEETLEPLEADENGFAFDITPSVAKIVDAFLLKAGVRRVGSAGRDPS